MLDRLKNRKNLLFLCCIFPISNKALYKSFNCSICFLSTSILNLVSPKLNFISTSKSTVPAVSSITE